MNAEQIFIDMDGTIVDYHDRFYIIYNIACCEKGIKPLSKEKWLYCRKNDIPTYTRFEHEAIAPLFEKLFESPDYLCFDKLIYGMDNVINTLKNKYKVYIVSFRSQEINLKNQLKEYNINNIGTIIKGFTPSTVMDEKANMIQKVIPNPSGWIIGDTPYEITAGKKLGLKTIACTWGDKSKSILEKYNPNYIVNYSKEILKIINVN